MDSVVLIGRPSLGGKKGGLTLYVTERAGVSALPLHTKHESPSARFTPPYPIGQAAQA